MIEKTQQEINQWEIENRHLIIRWEKDFEKNTIEFELKDKTKIIYKIII